MGSWGEMVFVQMVSSRLVAVGLMLPRVLESQHLGCGSSSPAQVRWTICMLSSVPSGLSGGHWASQELGPCGVSI